MDDLRTLYRERGWAVLPERLPDIWLATLRDICDRLLDIPAADATQYHDIDLGEKRRFLRHAHVTETDLRDALFTGPLAAAARAFLGDTLYLFNEQFVVKGPDDGASFAWHQDSAYVDIPHKTYLSLWVALDDTTLENGCLYLLDRNLDRDENIVPHIWNEEMKERVGYQGSDLGQAVECPAGTIVAFSSVTLHRSGGNVTPDRRRAYLAQYSPEPIRDPQTGAARNFVDPVPV